MRAYSHNWAAVASLRGDFDRVFADQGNGISLKPKGTDASEMRPECVIVRAECFQIYRQIGQNLILGKFGAFFQNTYKVNRIRVLDPV